MTELAWAAVVVMSANSECCGSEGAHECKLQGVPLAVALRYTTRCGNLHRK